MIKDFPKNINWKRFDAESRYMPKLKIVDISNPNNIIIFDEEFYSHGNAWSYLYKNKFICQQCKEQNTFDEYGDHMIDCGCIHCRWLIKNKIKRKTNIYSPCRLKYLIIDSINLPKCKTYNDYFIWQEFEYK
jgi:hypothetical protein